MLPMQSSVTPDEVGQLIALARRRMKQFVSTRLTRYGLGPQQFWVLLNLRKEEGLSLHQLAERTWTDDPTACRIVAKLVDRGLVRSTEDENDRRRFHLGLTPKGRKLTGELADLADEVKVSMTKGISSENRKELCGLLRRVVTNLDGLLEDGQTNGKPAAKRSKRGKG
jgi:DNA-binding MarR family transcriptional regulator